MNYVFRSKKLFWNVTHPGIFEMLDHDLSPVLPDDS